jgi:hypothetical protein
MAYDDQPGALGRHIEHDERSRAFAAPALAEPRTVLWERHSRPFDQGSYGACTGFAAAGALCTTPLHRPGEVWRARHAFRLYGAATRLDSFPGTWTPDDTGSSGLAVAKAAHNAGYITRYTHVFGIEHAKRTIADGPFITGTWWYSSFNRPGSDGQVKLDRGSVVEGGHEYEVVGYDAAEDVWRFANSWSPAWGDRGYFTMAGALYADLLANDGDATVLVR